MSKKTPPIDSPVFTIKLQKSLAERQRLLETDDVVSRLQQELQLLKREMPRTIGPFSLN